MCYVGDSTVLDAVNTAETIMHANGVPMKLETPAVSVAAQLKVIDGLTPSDNGLFLAHTGGEWRVPT